MNVVVIARRTYTTRLIYNCNLNMISGNNCVLKSSNVKYRYYRVIRNGIFAFYFKYKDGLSVKKLKGDSYLLFTQCKWDIYYQTSA